MRDVSEKSQEMSKAPPIKETSWSSALRVNAKVFQWVKKVLSIVRKKSLKGIRSLKPFLKVDKMHLAAKRR